MAHPPLPQPLACINLYPHDTAHICDHIHHADNLFAWVFERRVSRAAYFP